MNFPYKLSNFNNNNNYNNNMINNSNNIRKRANTQTNKTKPKPKKPVKQIQQPPMVFDNPADDDLMEDNIENLNMNPIPIQEPPHTNNRKNNNRNVQYTNPNDNNKINKNIKDDDDDDFFNEGLEEKQDYLISSHMNVIKDEAKLLTEEGNLISNIKGVTDENYTMDEYAKRLEEIIERKLEYYKELKKKIEEYKKMVQK
jgi:hypothetical protein